MTQPEIRKLLESAAKGHCEQECLNEYMRFTDEAQEPPPGAASHAHHRIPKMLFTGKYESFDVDPWNRKVFSRADHLKAHTLLFRALPENYQIEPGFAATVKSAPKSKNLKLVPLAKLAMEEAREERIWWKRHCKQERENQLEMAKSL
jgi:hypothetical protein